MSQQEIVQIVLGSPNLREFSFKFDIKNEKEVQQVNEIQEMLERNGWQTWEKNMFTNMDSYSIELKLRRNTYCHG